MRTNLQISPIINAHFAWHRAGEGRREPLDDGRISAWRLPGTVRHKSAHPIDRGGDAWEEAGEDLREVCFKQLLPRFVEIGTW